MNDSIGAFGMWLAVGLGSLGFFFSPIGKSVGRWIESWGGASRGSTRELEARVAELEQMIQRTPAQGVPAERLAELEERVDFAERMLAQKERPTIGPGG